MQGLESLGRAVLDSLTQLPNPARVAVELHAAERAALIEIADRIGGQLGLLRKGMLAKVLGAAGRAIAEIVGAVIVPP
jgi:DNA-directed RNA polymerase specialized sigma24 family protein